MFIKDGLLKRLENEELHIEFISKRNMKQYQDVVDLFWKNIKNFINCSFKKNLKDTNIVKNEREKNEILMKFLDSMNHNISWVLILSSDNAVHKW